jgi:hypothetical protein
MNSPGWRPQVAPPGVKFAKKADPEGVELKWHGSDGRPLIQPLHGCTYNLPVTVGFGTQTGDQRWNPFSKKETNE